MFKKYFLKFIGLASSVLLLTSCATGPQYQRVESSLRQGDYHQASQAVEASASKYGASSQLLYLFDSAMLRHLDGDYQGSNQAIEKANQLIDELYTKSLSKGALSLVWNDTAQDYTGEDFERVMLHILGMLNYTFLKQPDEALVEARRADERLSSYVQQYGNQQVYKEDSLARYLSAVLYEKQDKLSDAYIDYKKSREAFQQYSAAYGTPMPPFLADDLLRLSQALGFDQDTSQWRREFGKEEAALSWEDLKNTKGELILLLYEGFAPVKEDRFVSVPVGSLYFKVAFPHFVSRPQLIRSATLSSPEKGLQIPLALFEDIDAIAIKDLDARIGRISAKAIARAVAKYAAGAKLQEEARKSGNFLAELFTFVGTNAYTLVAEQADKRSWRTLPAHIYLARMALAPGTYHLNLNLDTFSGPVIQTLPEIEVEAGKKIFLRSSIY